MFQTYTADAFVFDVQELLLCELHVQEVLENQPITEHGALQGKHTSPSNQSKKKKKTPT